ncbi:MAG: adenylate kinase [Candidatus Micrarchaeota archaeon]
MNLVFLGKQGAGKGTYAQRLSVIKKIPQLSTGDLFRQEVATGSDLGKKIGLLINAGNLVPNELSSEILEKRMRKPDCKNGFILDGFPRNLDQAEMLDKLMAKLGKKIDKVINFFASDEVLMSRLTSRRTCKNCNKIFNIKTLKPKKEGVCDDCGGELYQRDDDQPRAIQKRFAIYEQQTKPLIEYYRKKGLLVDLVGDGLIENVISKLTALMDKK